MVNGKRSGPNWRGIRSIQGPDHPRDSWAIQGTWVKTHIDKYQALIADKYTLTVDVAIGDAEMNEMKRMINNSDKLRGLKLYKEQKSINLLTP